MLKVARRCSLTAWSPDKGERRTTAHREACQGPVNNPFTETPRGNPGALVAELVFSKSAIAIDRRIEPHYRRLG
jgi:hypothetical protein